MVTHLMNLGTVAFVCSYLVIFKSTQLSYFLRLPLSCAERLSENKLKQL